MAEKKHVPITLFHQRFIQDATAPHVVMHSSGNGVVGECTAAVEEADDSRVPIPDEEVPELSVRQRVNAETTTEIKTRLREALQNLEYQFEVLPDEQLLDSFQTLHNLIAKNDASLGIDPDKDGIQTATSSQPLKLRGFSKSVLPPKKPKQ